MKGSFYFAEELLHLQNMNLEEDLLFKDTGIITFFLQKIVRNELFCKYSMNGKICKINLLCLSHILILKFEFLFNLWTRTTL